jgi:hypothetical protein
MKKPRTRNRHLVRGEVEENHERKDSDSWIFCKKR